MGIALAVAKIAKPIASWRGRLAESSRRALRILERQLYPLIFKPVRLVGAIYCSSVLIRLIQRDAADLP
jgi:hypothetical protein